MLTNSSISKVTEKDLNGGMICKSLFKPSDAKRIGSNEIITSRNNSIPTKKISNNIVQTDGKSILNRNNSSYLLKASSKDLNNKTGMEYPNNVYNKDIYKPSKSLNTCTGIVKKMENKNELLTNSSMLDCHSSSSTLVNSSSNTNINRNNSAFSNSNIIASDNNLNNTTYTNNSNTKLNKQNTNIKVNKQNLNDLQNLYLFKNTLISNANANNNSINNNNNGINNKNNDNTTTNNKSINNAVTSNTTTNIQNDPKTADSNENKSVKNLIKKDILIIHVYDENRNIKKDFSCDRNLIFKEMKYFESFLLNKINNGSLLNNSKIEIDVHCDIEVFEWLMAYLLKKNVALTKRTVISILISSNFLKMERLENECIKFFHDNMNDILKVPFDMSCINNELIEKLLNSFTEIELDEIVDKKDKIISQLYIMRLENLLMELEKKLITFTRCQYCHCFYANNLKYKVFCPFARAYIDFHGNIIMTHKPEENFNSTEYIINLIENNQYTAKEVYWHVWNAFKSFKCKNCNNLFFPEQQVTCLYHPKDIIEKNEEFTLNSCCKTKNYDFHPFYLSKGCQYKSHIPVNPEDEKIIKICRKTTLSITKSICSDLNCNFKAKDAIYSFGNITEIDLRNFETWSEINLIHNNQINEKITKPNNNISGGGNNNNTNNIGGSTKTRSSKSESEKSKKKKIETYLIKEREKKLMNSIIEKLSPPS